MVAIEKKLWPEEWVYLVWRTDIYRLPTILRSHLYRLDVETGDNSYRIKPIALQPAEGEVAYFYNNFEKLTKVTIIGQNRPGFFDTIRLILTPDDQVSREIFQTLSGHRLFKLKEKPVFDPPQIRSRQDPITTLEISPQTMPRELTSSPEVGWKGADSFGDFWLETISVVAAQGPSTFGVWSRLFRGRGLLFVLNFDAKSRGVSDSGGSWPGAVSVLAVPGPVMCSRVVVGSCRIRAWCGSRAGVSFNLKRRWPEMV